MNFLANLFAQLEAAADSVILRELRDRKPVTATGRELLQMIAEAQEFLDGRPLRKGDRVALLAHNSIRWIAMDLAIMSKGYICVPLYARQSAAELVAMMRDCTPALICTGDSALRESITLNWLDGPSQFLFDEIFSAKPADNPPAAPEIEETDPVAILYTSGTSGEAKGVVLTAGNIGHILGCTSARLDILMNHRPGQDRVYQWAPLCFAAARITLMTSLMRRSLISMNTDLSKIAAELRIVAPDYFVNVPALLERVRRAVDEQLWKTGGFPLTVYSNAKAAWTRKQEGKSNFADFFWIAMAKTLIFPAIRRKMIGRNLKALICGSAPLSIDTQQYFMMLGIPVLQVYGLTETTAICTMDDPRHVEPGRVGPAIPGIEMKLGDNDEILVRGPNIFRGYWHRPDETAKALRDGWFHTGDQGEVSAAGNWRIIGRIKNLIILNSGHNIAPEPIEDELLKAMPAAQQIVLIGNGRGFLSAIITGDVKAEKAQAAIDEVNAALPHYKQIRRFYLRTELFSVENGLMTVNGKLKRDLIAARLQDQIEEMYQAKQPA